MNTVIQELRLLMFSNPKPEFIDAMKNKINGNELRNPINIPTFLEIIFAIKPAKKDRNIIKIMELDSIILNRRFRIMDKSTFNQCKYPKYTECQYH